MTKKYFLLPAIALALVSCSQTDEPGVLTEPKQADFSAQIGETNSRAAGTEWDSGDAIGISGVSGTKAYNNLEFVTESGDGNFAAVVEHIFYQTTDEVTFTAYYPYAASLGADGIITASTADQTKQSSFDFLWAQASGSYSAPAVNFNFTHKMSKINIAFTNGNDVDLSDMTFYIEGLVLDGTFDTTTGEAKAAENGTAASLTAALSPDSKASMIVFPQDADNLTVNVTAEGQQYSCTLSPGVLTAGNAYTFTISVKKTGMSVVGSIISDWTGGGEFNGNATMPVPARRGDYFYSDGTYSSTLDAAKTCIGIVFWTPADANPDPNAKTPASLTDDKIMAADFPDCTHGLVIALQGNNKQIGWIASFFYNIFDDFQNTDNFHPADKEKYRPIASGYNDTDALNYILGYQNTKILKAYKEWNNGSAPAIHVLDALESFSAQIPAPKNTTGWYIPSAKELSLLTNNDLDNVYSLRAGENNKNYINSLLKMANGSELPSSLWSSTEGLTGAGTMAEAKVYVFSDLSHLAIVTNYYISQIRPVLAF